MNWRIGAPARVDRLMALRVDDLGAINGDLLAATRQLLAIAESTRDGDAAAGIYEQINKLSELSRRLSLATRDIAHATVALLETT
jgi:hypothetical protein